jgi:hypothetical protein
MSATTVGRELERPVAELTQRPAETGRIELGDSMMPGDTIPQDGQLVAKA